MKMFKRAKAMLLTGIMTAGILLTGCGKQTNLWLVHLEEGDLDVSVSFEDFIEEAVNKELVPMDIQKAFIYDENAENSGIKILSGDVDTDKLVYVLHIDNEDDVQSFWLNLENYKSKVLRDFESDDGISRSTDEDELPKEYLFLNNLHSSGARGTEDLHCYYAVVVDGKYYDLTEYVDKLPKKIDRDDFDEYREAIRDMGMTVSRLVPNVLNHPEGYTDAFADNYKKDDALKNCFAITDALADCNEKLRDGEIENFGYIAYYYVNGKMMACDYFVITEN